MNRKRTRVLLFVLCAGALILVTALAGGSSTKPAVAGSAKLASGMAGGFDTAGEGPVDSYEAYLSAERTYPANVIPPSLVQQAGDTFSKIQQQDSTSGDPSSGGSRWSQYGPQVDAQQPGVTVVLRRDELDRKPHHRDRRVARLRREDERLHRLGRRVGRRRSGAPTTRSIANPDWKQMTDMKLDQNSVGALTLDPTDPSGQHALSRHR